MSEDYVPPPSIGHEIGVMFGFIGLMISAMGLYLVLWQLGQKRSARKEAERRQELSSRGFGGEKSVDRGIDDGMA
ncbi:MAG: hypothetical protein M1830_001041 [Pleopsidium flavum]|nr:MAG: hypothetical protein M1830_007258 [Pleopsidium flavum]KAI9872937.1 MAG: hypothetical protein M1830_001041 [Pleopsidium flavum]